ncbi:hypothetical protein EC973_005067 [Apophysomyces ossiformis]|uniref:DDHD domain-containing protein n=1 Tax=Apophysomyces ossiformis TaxID=679940 RepID=A0A8H7ERP2_9FUNG|nr:hypothetical protein EC973_005067 [Apophysomyces ossiformis]
MFFESAHLTPSELISDEDVASTTSTLAEEENLDEVDHIVFVIHGIGQQTEEYGYFHEHLGSLQRTAREVLQARVPDHSVRIKLVPIEWHRHIHEQTDDTIDRITLKSMPTIRLVSNHYLSDVLYYFSKDRGQSIVNHVTETFNQAYRHLMTLHPTFHGKIAIFGYSLGGLITWDILSNQHQPTSAEEVAQRQKLEFQCPKLDFQPDYFFGIGSPLGALLTVRNQNPQYYHPHPGVIFENIFHPFDPLAYRFEPLINDDYTEEPAIVMERSVPLMSSLPGGRLLSLFSWKSNHGTTPTSKDCYFQEKDRRDSIQEASTTEEMLPASSCSRRSSTGSLLSSSVNAFLHYFSSRTDMDADKEDASVQAEEEEEEEEDEKSREAWQHGQQEDSSVESLTPDSIFDESEPEPKLSLSDHETFQDDPCERKLRRRSRTFGSPLDFAIEANSTPSQRRQHHIVQVLGIDAVRGDHFKSYFDKLDPTNPSDWMDVNNAAKSDEEADEVQVEAMMAPPTEPRNQYKLLPGDHRMDYVLQPESFMSMIANEYLVGIRAHFSYWTNKDLLWHIICRLENLPTNPAAVETSL